MTICGRTVEEDYPFVYCNLEKEMCTAGFRYNCRKMEEGWQLKIELGGVEWYVAYTPLVATRH